LDEEKPILVHCTLGKDRTGCIIALLEKALRMDDEDIVTDYVSSSRNAFSANIKILLQVIEEFGGIDSFLLAVGLSKSDLDALRAQFGC
jgi:protein-tyrosine phosphatase